MFDPDDVLEGLSRRWGIEISRVTLQRWTKAGLVPEPVTGSLGRGRGRFTIYPEGTLEEAAASWWVLRLPGFRLSLPVVAEARAAALKFHKAACENRPSVREYLAAITAPSGPKLSLVWLIAWRKAVASYPLDKPAKVTYQWVTTTEGRGSELPLGLVFKDVKLEPADADILDVPAILRYG